MFPKKTFQGSLCARRRREMYKTLAYLCFRYCNSETSVLTGLRSNRMRSFDVFSVTHIFLYLKNIRSTFTS